MNKVKKIATIFALAVTILGVSSLYTSTSVSASRQDTWLSGDTEYEPRIIGERQEGIPSGRQMTNRILSPSRTTNVRNYWGVIGNLNTRISSEIDTRLFVVGASVVTHRVSLSPGGGFTARTEPPIVTRLANNNVRIILSGNFTGLGSARTLTHMWNAHGNGEFSFRAL